MKFLDILQDILLASIIAILIPVTLHRGINLIYNGPEGLSYSAIHKTDSTAEDKIKDEKMSELRRKKYQNIIFYSFMATGIILIITGILLPINALSLGLTGGGTLNIFVGIFNKSNIFFNFGILLFILIILVIVSIYKAKRKNNTITP